MIRFLKPSSLPVSASAGLLVLRLAGPGRFSLDRLFFGEKSRL